LSGLWEGEGIDAKWFNADRSGASSGSTEANLRILRAYGAEIDFVSKPHPETGKFLQA
jgi:hypothetical protein